MNALAPHQGRRALSDGFQQESREVSSRMMANSLCVKWESRIALKLRVLRPADRKEVLSGTLEEMRNQHTQLQEIDLAKLHLENIRNDTSALEEFLEEWLCKAGIGIDGSPIWGLYTLVMSQLLEGEPRTFEIVLPSLGRVFSNAQILNAVLQKVAHFTYKLNEACVDFALHIVAFLVGIFRQIDRPCEDATLYQCLEHNEEDTISKLKSTSDTLLVFAIPYMHASSSRATNYATFGSQVAAPRLGYDVFLTEMAASHIRPSTIAAQWGCLGRHAVIDSISKAFTTLPSQEFVSRVASGVVVIHGLGGVGKSATARLFAYTAKAMNPGYDCVWIHSETRFTQEASFNEIAMKLKLPGANLRDPNHNRAAVLELLRRKPFLIIFDNADDPRLINEYLPHLRHCQIICTTRKQNFTTSRIEPSNYKAIELGPLGDEHQVECLLYLLGVSLEEIDYDDKKNVKELTRAIGGHALTLELLAAEMKRRNLGITRFRKFLREHMQQNPIRDGDSIVMLKMVCRLIFKSLDHSSLVLLGLMSYLDPDKIPQELFRPPATTELSGSLRNIIGELQLSTTMQLLRERKLVSCNESSTTTFYSLHRVVQEYFRLHLTPAQRQEAFDNATILVSAAFPRHDSTNAQLYEKWGKCNMYLTQVMRLRDASEKERDLRPLQTYCELNVACQRYLLERYSIGHLRSLVETNLRLIKLLPQSAPLKSLLGNTTSHKGQMLAKTGHSKKGIEYLRKSYDYFCSEDPPNIQECGWAAGNMADALHTSNQGDDAHKWQKVALGHFEQWYERAPEPKVRHPAAMLVGHAVTMAWNGRHSEARDVVMKASKQAVNELPDDWATAAMIWFTLATISWLEGKLEESAQLFKETLEKWNEGDQNNHPVSGACLYRLGCVSLGLGKMEDAVKYLRDAVEATQENSQHMKGEYMRCIFKLSEALLKDPSYEQSHGEGTNLRGNAKELLHEFFPLNTENDGLAETYDRLVCISWR